MARGRKKQEEVVEEQPIMKEEESTMTEQNELDFENMEDNKEVVTEEVAVEEVVVAPVEYISDNTGKPISRSAYIRQEFLKDRPRGEIAKELGCAYGIVYSATANMENAVHKATEDGGTARGAVMEHPTTGEMVARADYCREQVEAGRSRGDLAKELGVAYATIYAATKEQTPAGGAAGGSRVHVEVDGESKPRAQYIREQFEAGMTRREIANEIGCDYAVVWAATKTLVEKAKEAGVEEVTTEDGTLSEQAQEAINTDK